MSFMKPVKHALISVSDKTHVIKIAKILIENKINLLSTEGTAKILRNYNIPVTTISDYINFPEIMNGRVKTLHPKIMAGILRRSKDAKIMQLYKINPIDIVIVNFYPFQHVPFDVNNNIKDVINNIDIGGPTLVRAAAKNYKHVIVIVDINDIELIIDAIKKNSININTRLKLAQKAFQYTSSYELTIAKYFSQYQSYSIQNKHNFFPNKMNFSFIKKQDLVYGENQHQKSAFYIKNNALHTGTISFSNQVHGKRLSYNNILDANTALECVKEFKRPSCVIVKHGNPCGAATRITLVESYLCAYNADPVSAFGGVLAFNYEIDENTAQKIITTQFVEVIIAPKISAYALKILQQKKNTRILVTGKIHEHRRRLEIKSIDDGMLIQENDINKYNHKKWTVVTDRTPTKQEIKDSIFCWKIAKFIKSNAIVYGYNETTIAIGAGQMSRIDSIKLANIKVKERGYNIMHATMASDAFLPFRDNIDQAAKIGITCVIQTGGSIRDHEVIQAANEHNITMIFTKTRHFRH